MPSKHVWLCIGVLTYATAHAYSSVPTQHAFMAPSVDDNAPAGRFLHITDMHLDKHYKEGAAVSSQCHWDGLQRMRDGERLSGYWGTQESDCDAPYRLANATLAWLALHWTENAKQQRDVRPFDFVLWTGDSARHEQDMLIPRTADEISASNRDAVELFEQHLPGVPIVPNFGNNDVVLHNTMPGGPSDELERFLGIWGRHIPDHQREAFLRGGYFAKDLIPDKLGVISMNTLYFYDSNKAVDGCPRRKRSSLRDNADPGTLQLEWLVERLIEFRRRNMQVHLVGHVPPTSGNYFKRCFDLYTELVLRFQDTIVGQHFGHMNLDAFFVQESSLANGRPPHNGGKVPIVRKPIEDDLRHDYESLPGNARTDMQYYGVFYEAPSVVPTYKPSVRVWTYNTTMARMRPALSQNVQDERLLLEYVAFDACDNAFDCEWLGEEDVDVYGKGRRHRRPKRRHRRRHARLPRYASEEAPSRMNTFLTPLGYSQWTLDLTKTNALYNRVLKSNGPSAAARVVPNYTLEYTTYDAATLWYPYIDEEAPQDIVSSQRQNELLGHHYVPVPKPLLDAHLAQHNLRTPFVCRKSSCKVAKSLKPLTMYSLPDMTLQSVMDLARRLAVDRKMWTVYVERLYTSVFSKTSK